MSGIYIKDMEMPQNCDECPLNSTCGYSLHMPLYHTEKRHDDCPLIEVPEPHGDLIDRKTLMEGEGRYFISICKEGIDVEEILRAKTIIPASKEE